MGILNSLDLSLFEEDASCSVAQEVPNVSWNIEVRYGVYKNHSPVSIRNQIN
jgi:hypothetical protein